MTEFYTCEKARQFTRAFLHDTAVHRQAHYHRTCDDGRPPPTLKCNATRIHQVLLNLCVNASHAVDDEKGAIHLRFAKTTIATGAFERFPGIGGAVVAEIIISDNGYGMTPEI